MIIREHIHGIRKYYNLLVIVFFFCMMATFSFLAAQGMKNSSAVSTSGFRPGNIISDAVMGNYGTMSKDDIQRFLSSKNKCSNTNYSQYQSLKSQYPNTDWHFENGHFVCLSEERFGDGTTIGSGQTAAEIIYQAAQDYRINPQVILVLLEKEQGLISDTYPNSIQYRAATGFGCPDTAACSTEYYGFKNQVRQAAKMFRSVLDGGWSNYPAGKTSYIQYNPNKNCGGSNVYIENRATSALYRYTPYQPNTSALSAGYGTGDSCGAYGNRNFYLFFTDWFGSAQVNVEGDVIDIPDGEYFFTPQVSGSYALGVASGSGNGTNIQLVNYNASDARQKWRVSKTSDGYYQLTHVATGKALDVNGGYANQGDNINLWDRNNSCGQKWKLYSTSDGSITFESACMPAMTLDLHGGVPYAGANISIWLSNNGSAQKWNLRVGRTIEDGVYSIHSRVNPGKVIDIDRGLSANGTNIHIWNSTAVDNPGNNQKWLISYNNASDYYTITNQITGKALDLNGGIAGNGKNINLWSTNNTCAQQWKIMPRTDKTYMIVSSCSLGYALDVYGGVDKNGSNVNLWNVHEGTSERWTFNKVEQLISDGTYSLLSQASMSQAIDVFGGYTHNSANVSSWNFHGGSSERWTIKYNPATKDYTITNPASNKNLDVQDAATFNGANIQIYDKNNTCAQRWQVVITDGAYQFLSTCNTNKALDLNGGMTWNGVNIQLWDRNSTSAQKWYLKNS